MATYRMLSLSMRLGRAVEVDSKSLAVIARATSAEEEKLTTMPPAALPLTSWEGRRMPPEIQGPRVATEADMEAREQTKKSL
jgi:hypothetical protein